MSITQKPAPAGHSAEDTGHHDSHDLARFGYAQELKRALGVYSSFAVAFSYISPSTGIFTLYFLGFGLAGPAFFWSWPIVIVGQLIVGLNFAELSSHFPVAGSVYQWTKYLAGKNFAWFTGWIYLFAGVLDHPDRDHSLAERPERRDQPDEQHQHSNHHRGDHADQHHRAEHLRRQARGDRQQHGCCVRDPRHGCVRVRADHLLCAPVPRRPAQWPPAHRERPTLRRQSRGGVPGRDDDVAVRRLRVRHGQHAGGGDEESSTRSTPCGAGGHHRCGHHRSDVPLRDDHRHPRRRRQVRVGHGGRCRGAAGQHHPADARLGR
ncbi:MAG: amino acid permease [Chloroflexi bacterium]|nr:MAG: amino acid permease [Chloroflexota bacterium]